MNGLVHIGAVMPEVVAGICRCRAAKLEGSPVIVCDNREQAPLPIRAYPTIRAALPVGDYSILGFHDWQNPGFCIERKSLEDLCGSLGRERERFMREVEKMRAFRFRALVIEANPADVEGQRYRSQIAPSAVFGTLDALAVRAGLHVFWCGDSEGAARKVESLVGKFARGIQKDYQRLMGNGDTNKQSPSRPQESAQGGIGACLSM